MPDTKYKNKFILNCHHAIPREALMAAKLGFWSYDHRDGSASWCPQLYALLGRKVGDYPEDPDGWFSLVHPLDQSRVAQHMEEARSLDIPVYDIVFRMRHADGYWIKVHSRGRVVDLDEQGHPIRTLGTTNFLDEAQSILDGPCELESVLGKITDNISDVLWIANPDIGAIDYISQSYEAIWGRPVSALYAQPDLFMESVHPDDHDMVRAHFSKQEEGLPFDLEFRIIRADGDIRWIWDRGFPIFNEDGQVMQYMGLARDITLHKAREQQLREANAALKAELDQLKATLRNLTRLNRSSTQVD